METSLEKKKAFALAQIAPYYKDPSTCGINGHGSCKYITSNGKMCVLGKNLLPSVRHKADTLGGAQILLESFNSQSECLIPEAVDMLTADEWQNLQRIHDYIAKKKDLKHAIELLGLFTLNELKNYGKISFIQRIKNYFRK